MNLALLWPVPVGLLVVVGLWRLRRALDPPQRLRAAHRGLAAVIGIALSYVPLSYGDVHVLGFPFPVAFSVQHGEFRELASLGAVGLLSVAGNALFAREIGWLVVRGRRRARQGAPNDALDPEHID
ncbi:hypothetical protein WMF31_40505 [Sorangium sp. So ce1036]|uniref:hypothetical protein n=1 Tax=Sorangium sp. So ce1036 TaxID=3133328 RepID=UPI003F110FA4